jgi:hypothetical protein
VAQQDIDREHAAQPVEAFQALHAAEDARDWLIRSEALQLMPLHAN